MSKATQRRKARGEKWFVVDRRGSTRVAFEEGLRLIAADRRAKDALLDGTLPNWKGMARLSKEEKERVRKDVLEFARANAETLRKLWEKPQPTFVDKMKAAFKDLLGA